MSGWIDFNIERPATTPHVNNGNHYSHDILVQEGWGEMQMHVVNYFERPDGSYGFVSTVSDEGVGPVVAWRELPEKYEGDRNA